MSDVVVTVPKAQWQVWLEEGDLPGEMPTGLVSHFWIGRLPSTIDYFDDRLYVVAHGRLRGYAPIWGYEAQCELDPSRACIMRRGVGMAVTIPETIKGFQGWRYRWWDRDDETPFPDWKTAGVR